MVSRLHALISEEFWFFPISFSIFLCPNPRHDARLEQLIKGVVHKRATEDLRSRPETLGPSRDPGSAHHWEFATLSAEGRFRIRRAQTLWAHCCSVWLENEVSWTLEREWENTWD